VKAPSANGRAVLFRKSMVGVDVVYKSLAFRKAVHAPLKGNQYFVFRAPFSKVCTRTEFNSFANQIQ
jgi:hypothetical protein